jgi:hypothetical protein
MICQQCRNEIAENAIICPVCGTLKSPLSQQPGKDQAYPQGDFQQPPENYGYYQQNNRGGYQGGYAPPPPQQPINQQGYQGYVPPQQNYRYVPPYSTNQGYTSNINVTVINNSSGGKNDGALVAEIILSLLGIFGIGWLLAGETTVGIIMLLCSIFLYWPIMFFGTLFTFGFGLIFLGPLMIASIIINAVLLNNAIKRKAAPFVIVQQPPMQMPPQR